MSFYISGRTPALKHAAQILRTAGIVTTESPQWSNRHLLLDVPSFRPGSSLCLDTLLNALPRDITIWGGNLQHPALEEYRCVDLLKEEAYLLENASITADCAIALIDPILNKSWQDVNVLIIGWGRIGKFLAKQLKSMTNHLTIAARKEQDCQSLHLMGYQPVRLTELKEILPDCDLIINTVPAEVLTEEDLSSCRNCLKIDLASKKGIAGEDVIWARGLPGIHAPDRSGRLIAQTILRILKEAEK